MQIVRIINGNLYNLFCIFYLDFVCIRFAYIFNLEFNLIINFLFWGSQGFNFRFLQDLKFSKENEKNIWNLNLLEYKHFQAFRFY